MRKIVQHPNSKEYGHWSDKNYGAFTAVGAQWNPIRNPYKRKPAAPKYKPKRPAPKPRAPVKRRKYKSK